MSQVNDFILQLDTCPLGSGGWVQFENICTDILSFLFVPPLSPPNRQARTYSGVNRRDAIFPNRNITVWMEGRIPDIVASKAGRKLLVEIVVTHDLSEDKIEWIRHRGLATVRVNLSWIGYGVDKSIIERCLYDGRAVNITPRFNIVNWVYHPREAEAQQRVNEQYLMSIKGGSFEQQKVKKAESKEVQLKLKF